MKYIKVRWHHSFPDTPVVLYSELDDALWEIRKVEVYRDGRMDFADQDTSSGTTLLGSVPLPPLEQIAADLQFQPEWIPADEFEVAWRSSKGAPEP